MSSSLPDPSSHSSQNAPIKEGVDPNSLFRIPAGYTLLEAGSDGAVEDKFDWDAIRKNPNLELWLIRVPNNLPIKHLDSIYLPLLSPRRPEKAGELTRKQTTYDIWSCDVSHPDGVDGDMPYGEEMNSITCLLPRKSKNALFAASKPISRHVVITAQPAQSQPAAAGEGPATIFQNPPRQSYPPELLKHRFMPYGSLANAKSSREESGTEGQEHEHKIHSKSNVDDTLGPIISMGIDAPQSYEKKNKDKKEKKGKNDISGVEHTDKVVPSFLMAGKAKTAKKRKTGEDTNEGTEVERKKVKKLKVKGT